MDIIYTAAQMMELSARTAPKSLGQDFIATKIVSGDVIFKLADELDRIFNETQRENFDRDAETIRKSEAILFIGIKDSKEIGLNCGACGFDTCEENLVNREKRTDFVGPLCSFRMLDMGIALGSAVKTASIL
ncbi:MAG: hypothetical protein GY839_06450, partial [candidate division Zixibacteria bacterium]|nr:hypothetical protein [candidate division Zixibacteria bacterium]